jgi:prepilin-type N-terminal cleavage/methylation domain-containing protein
VGFTLIELVCVIILVAILGTGLTVGFSTFASGQLSVRQNFTQSMKLQVAVTRILYELKSTSSVSVSSNIITLSSKTLYVSGSNLILNTGGTEHVLTDNISNFSATYASGLVHVSFDTGLADGAKTQTSLYVHV